MYVRVVAKRACLTSVHTIKINVEKFSTLVLFFQYVFFLFQNYHGIPARLSEFSFIIKYFMSYAFQLLMQPNAKAQARL